MEGFTQIRIKQLWCCKESQSNPTDFIILILFENNSSTWLQCNNKHEITKLVSSHYTPPFKILLSLLFVHVFACIQVLSLFKCLKPTFPTEGITRLLPAVPWVIPHSNKAKVPGPSNFSQPKCSSWSHQISNNGINFFPWEKSFKEISGIPSTNWCFCAKLEQRLNRCGKKRVESHFCFIEWTEMSWISWISQDSHHLLYSSGASHRSTSAEQKTPSNLGFCRLNYSSWANLNCRTVWTQILEIWRMCRIWKCVRKTNRTVLEPKPWGKHSWTQSHWAGHPLGIGVIWVWFLWELHLQEPQSKGAQELTPPCIASLKEEAWGQELHSTLGINFVPHTLKNPNSTLTLRNRPSPTNIPHFTHKWNGDSSLFIPLCWHV